MNRVITPTPVADGRVDLSWLVGRTLKRLTGQKAGPWLFEFGGGTNVNVECLWRIIQEGRICATSEDHGHKFGLPAPFDAQSFAVKALEKKTVTSAALHPETADITLQFEGDVRLEIIPNSAGFESWQLRSPFGKSFVAQGGGQICEWET